MTPERIVGALLEGALGGRKKRSRGALGYLTGGRGGSLINANTLLAAAGLAWGAYEAATRNKGQASALAGGGYPQPPYPGPLTTGGGPLPPLPGVGGAPLAGPSVVPPLPGASAPAGPPADLLRLVRLTISAARVDGTLSEAERAQILEQARAVGAEAMVEEEIRNPKPLGEIVKGSIDPRQKEGMYQLAFAMVRADETVSGAERIYLAQLAHALGLDPAATARLEQEAGMGIDAAAAQEGEDA